MVFVSAVFSMSFHQQINQSAQKQEQRDLVPTDEGALTYLGVIDIVDYEANQPIQKDLERGPTPKHEVERKRDS